MHHLVSAAVQAFREQQRAQFLLDTKDRALTAAVGQMAQAHLSDADKAEYFLTTQSILDEYEGKRIKRGY